MSPDEYQQAWQAQSAQTRVTIDADLLLKHVQRNQKEMRAAITATDFGAIAIEFVLLPVFIFGGIAVSSPWTVYLMVPALLWSIGFKLVVRSRRKQTPNDLNESLLGGVKETLALVDHQIWLQRNAFWWSQLPSVAAMLVFFTHVAWQRPEHWMFAICLTAFFYVFVLAVYSFSYYMNQRVIRKQHEPRRQELIALLASLGDESKGEVGGEYPLLMGPRCVPHLSRRRIIAIVCALVLLAIWVPCIFFLVEYIDSNDDHEHSKLAPFTWVIWGADTPFAQIDAEWYTLVSIDGIAVKDIVAFSQRTYGDKWKQRFEEDLVEVLAGMGHEPGDTVQLAVLPLEGDSAKVLEKVPMTEANRRIVRERRIRGERREQQAPQSAVNAEDPEVPLTELIPRLRTEKQLVGLAAMVMVDGQVVASAVDGERKTGSGILLETGDQWHLGSITKSMTATMIARLVESGRMQWSDTIGTCFPDASIHEDWKPVTLRQLLTHTAGAPANFSIWVRRKKPAPGPECTKARRDAVLNVMAAKPENPPGETHAYSNVGVTIAGAMAEEVTGETWEDLVTREVFEPLALTGAGFGPPKSLAKTLDQPRGHTTVFGWKVAAGDDEDNTPIMGPAGIVHMTLEDLCTYATEHLRGELGEGKLLSAETYRYLHTPELDDYACGWVRKESALGIPHTMYWHNGSNTMWYALVVFVPDTRMVVAVTSNDGDIANAESAAWQVVRHIGDQFEADLPAP